MPLTTDSLSSQVRDLADLFRQVAIEGDGLDHGDRLELLRHRHSARSLAPRFTPRSRLWDTSLAAELPDEEFLHAVVQAATDPSLGAWRLLVDLAHDLAVCRRVAEQGPSQLAEAVTSAHRRDADLRRAQAAAATAAGSRDRAHQQLAHVQARVHDGAPVDLAARRRAEDQLADAQAQADRAHRELARLRATSDEPPPTAQEIVQARWELVGLRQQVLTLDARVQCVAVALAERRTASPPLQARPTSAPTWQVVTDLLDRAGQPLPTQLAGPLAAAWAGVRLPADRWSSVKRDAELHRRKGEHALVPVPSPPGSAWRAWVGLPDQPPLDDLRAACTAISAAASTGLHGVDPDGYLPVAATAASALDPDAPTDLAGLIRWSAEQQVSA